MSRNLAMDSILSHISDGIMITDHKRRIIYVNGVAERILQIKEATAIDEELLKVIPSSYLDLGIAIDALIEKVALTGIAAKLETSCLSALEKKDIYFSLNCCPFNSPAGENRDEIIVILRDMTKIYRLEQRIVDKRHLLKKIFDISPIGIINFDASGRITKLNQKALLIMKTESSKAMRMQFGDAFNCEGAVEAGCGKGEKCKRCSFRAAMVKTIEEGKAGLVEEEMTCVSGKERERTIWLKVNVTPFQLGGTERILMTMVDITDQKQRELAVKKSLDFHFQLLAGFPGLVWLRREKKTIYVNHRYEKFVGKTKEELLGFQWTSFVHPDDLDAYKQKHIGSDSFETEVRMKHKSGAYRWLWCINRPFYDLNGRQDGSIGIALDITDKKNIEMAAEHNKSQYRSLFMNMHSGFSYNRILFDQNGTPNDFKYVETNEDYLTLFKMENHKTVDRQFSELQPEIYLEQYELALTCGQIAQNGFGRLDKEFYCAYLGKWLSMSAYSFEKGFFAAIFTDITERKNYEEKLKEAVRLAKEANRIKSQFLANMSHEIRTPLNGMIGMIDLTLLTNLSTEQQENLRIAKSCANSLLLLINDILDFSKMEAGKIVLDYAAFDLKQMIEDIVKTHSGKAMEKGLDFFYTLPVNLPKAIMGDSMRLGQILHNLLTNAIKFTQMGGVFVSVKRVKEENGEEILLFSIEDTGIGIEEEDMEKLFKAFSQVDGSITRRFGGTGLGLMITKQLIELMGGRIWVTSEKQKGSKFNFSLPFEEVAMVEKTSDHADEVYENIEISKILLVEDDAVNQLVIGKMLAELGYEFQIAKNGLEAVQITRKKKFDCILMDIQMPKLDGMEATLEIRNNEKKQGEYTPIIALTAYAIKGDREKFLSYGMDEYLSKPVRMADLSEVLKNITVKKKEDEIESNVDDIDDLLAYCNEYGKNESTYETGKIELLCQLVHEVDVLANQNRYDEIDKKAEVLKETAAQCGADDVKSLVFKLQMAARRENKEDVVEYMKLLYDFIQKN